MPQDLFIYLFFEVPEDLFGSLYGNVVKSLIFYSFYYSLNILNERTSPAVSNAHTERT